MAPRVLLLGGNAVISRLMTSLMLAKSWTVVSVVRDSRQVDGLRALGRQQQGTIDVLVHDFETVKSTADARQILEKATPSMIIFAAGEFLHSDTLPRPYKTHMYARLKSIYN